MAIPGYVLINPSGLVLDVVGVLGVAVAPRWASSDLRFNGLGDRSYELCEGDFQGQIKRKGLCGCTAPGGLLYVDLEHV